MSSDLIVTRRRSPIWYVGWTLVFLVLLVITFYLGRFDSAEERELLEEERNILVKQVEENEQRIAELEQQTIVLQSSAQVDATASEQIMETISNLQQTIESLETELSFYRGIMAPELDVKGLQIADWVVKKGISPKSYSFQLALTQVKTHQVFLKGDVTIVVKGKQNNKTVENNITDLSNLSSNDLKFTFKYFQNIKGEITLPEGFEPKSVEITAVTSGRNGQTVTKQFNWPI
ncbi:MAG: hypothetical protein HWE27_05000 [Gammaproteobacteria bacterium]|nr:hypothetical protein [Gammaproteobacteria bacterium]